MKLGKLHYKNSIATINCINNLEKQLEEERVSRLKLENELDKIKKLIETITSNAIKQ